MITIVVLAVCWAQPVIEQLTSRVGNLRSLGRISGDPFEALGAAKALRLVATVITQPPWSFRDVLQDPAPSMVAAVLALGVLVAVLGWATWQGRRASDRLGLSAVITVIVLLAGAIVTATRAPLAASLRANTFGVGPTARAVALGDRRLPALHAPGHRGARGRGAIDSRAHSCQGSSWPRLASRS